MGGASALSASSVASDFSGAGSRWRSFLVLGRGQPEGETVYVMRQRATATDLAVVFINASTGRAYFAEDDTCPLRSVGMVASPDNVWANTQPFTEPWRMAWDLSDGRCWAPLFTPAHPFPGTDVLPLLQTPLQYRSPSARMAWALESEIASHLSGALRSWRPRFVTRIRGDMTTLLRNLCYELEARAAGFDGPVGVLGSEGRVQVGGAGGAAAAGALGLRGSVAVTSGAAVAGAIRDLSGEHQVALERAASRFRVVGFPLHATFTDMGALAEALRSTDLHRIEHEGVQYALAVAVCPYPNSVFSVWVYAVALLPQLYTTTAAAGPTVALARAAAEGSGASAATAGLMRASTALGYTGVGAGAGAGMGGYSGAGMGGFGSTLRGGFPGAAVPLPAPATPARLPVNSGGF